MVARNLEKGLSFFFSSGDAAPSSVGVVPSAFLPKAKGNEDLRFSDFMSFFSPLTGGETGVSVAASVVAVSAGTLAGEETSVLKGS